MSQLLGSGEDALMSEITVESKTAEVAHRELNIIANTYPEASDDIYEARDELEDKLDETQESLEATHG
jgi:hypothetical protein